MDFLDYIYSVFKKDLIIFGQFRFVMYLLFYYMLGNEVILQFGDMVVVLVGVVYNVFVVGKELVIFFDVIKL